MISERTAKMLEKAEPRVLQLSRRQRPLISRHLLPYVLLLPTFIMVGIFLYWPALSAVYYSFTNWEPGYAAPFVGVANYVSAFGDQVFMGGWGHLLLLVTFGVTVAFVVPFTVAELVLQVKNRRTANVLKALLILPMGFPSVVTILIWGFIFNPDQGALNQFLRLIHVLHGTVINWLGDPSLALYSIMLIGFPWVASLPFLVYMAGLGSIPAEYKDAARIDGASWWVVVFKIDVPLVWAQTRLLTVLAIVNWVQNLSPMLLLTDGGPAYATTTPGLWAYDQAFSFGNWGYASALSTILFLLMLVASLVSWRMMQSAAAQPVS